MIFCMSKRNVLVILAGGVAIAIASVVATIVGIGHLIGDN